MTEDEIIEITRKLGICELTSKPKQSIHYSLTIDEMLVFAKLVAEKAYEEGFFAGFEASGEGFNGEYPYLDKGIDIKTDKYVLHALKEAKEQE